MKLLIATNRTLVDVALLLLRLTVGVILFVVGAGKVLGWFGGQGMQATVQGFATMGIPASFTYLSSYTEFIGGALLAIGLWTRPAALLITINMLVATYVMLPGGFFLGGAAYPFTLGVVSLAILLAGPMAYSMDAWMLKQCSHGTA